MLIAMSKEVYPYDTYSQCVASASLLMICSMDAWVVLKTLLHDLTFHLWNRQVSRRLLYLICNTSVL